MPAKLGIIAGGGDLPALVAEACRQSGRDFCVIALEGQTNPDWLDGTDHTAVRLGAAAQALEVAREKALEEIVLVGHVRRPAWSELKPDWLTARFLARIGTKAMGDDGVLKAIVALIEDEGFRVVSVESVLSELLAPEGCLTRVRPTPVQEEDISYGLKIAEKIGDADIGQSVVVQQGLVLGVEAIEGTDALIGRCGGLKREGSGPVLIKIKKPDQERRVDLPTIGPETVSRAESSGFAGIAIEAGATLILHRDELVAAADVAGLFVTGIRRSS